MIVAIDGPAGSGKSTVAHAIAERCGFTFLDTGAMYRAVTRLCLDSGTPLDDVEAIARIAQGCEIRFGQSAGSQTVEANGRDVTSVIRSAEVDQAVSPVAAIPAVREAMVEQQRAMGAEGDVVAEGRDIGTVVFPEAEVKVFLTADARARAHRRAVQREGKDAATDLAAKADAAAEAQVLAEIEARDAYDSSRAVAPLKPAEDAVHIDSSELTVEEVVARIEALIEAARPPRGC